MVDQCVWGERSFFGTIEVKYSSPKECNSDWLSYRISNNQPFDSERDSPPLSCCFFLSIVFVQGTSDLAVVLPMHHLHNASPTNYDLLSTPRNTSHFLQHSFGYCSNHIQQGNPSNFLFFFLHLLHEFLFMRWWVPQHHVIACPKLFYSRCA